jgi:hypothetical protein
MSAAPCQHFSRRTLRSFSAEPGSIFLSIWVQVWRFGVHDQPMGS